jgi:hypothetical protein
VLRVELEEASYAAATMADGLLPGQVIGWEEICGGTSCPTELGQLRAYDRDGRLVFERILRVEDCGDGCRVRIDSHMFPAAVADCHFPHGNGGVIDYVYPVNRRLVLVAVRVRGEFRGWLDPGEGLEFMLFEGEGSASLTAYSRLGDLLWGTELTAGGTPGRIAIGD